MARPKNRMLILLLAVFSVSMVAVFFIRSGLESCDPHRNGAAASVSDRMQMQQRKNPLDFMASKRVLLVSHELTLSGGPLLLMELAFPLRGVGTQVVWITNQKPTETNEVTYNLERKMLDQETNEVTYNLERKMLDQGLQGTAAGGTTEIVVDGSTGLLHPVGKEGVTPLSENIVKLATSADQRRTMGRKGYERVKERFMEHHMADRLASVLREVIRKSKRQSLS